jgi:hypothetical protein
MHGHALAGVSVCDSHTGAISELSQCVTHTLGPSLWFLSCALEMRQLQARVLLLLLLGSSF